ncbi:MAG: PQQ-binding-like beta-propeller repeat protein [Ginsengibacter sp.]
MRIRPSHPVIFLIVIIVSASCKNRVKESYTNWKVYGGSKDASHYSSLTEVDTNNVAGLKVAWMYHTADTDTSDHSQMECNAVIVDGIFYATSPKMRLFALDAATGKQVWSFDPRISLVFDAKDQLSLPLTFSNTGRGVTYWSDGKNDKRIFYTAGYNLICVDALTGKLINTFGNKGRIDLHDGLDRDVKELSVTMTTPGIIYKDILIAGSSVAENATAAPGHIRAYDVRTGKQRWIFHTIPQPGEYGYDTWEDKEAWQHLGAANNWAGMSLDEERGIVFVPTGTVADDFYGGKRLGSTLFGNCLIALNASTGKRIWHFQTVHHDVWDRDLPNAPVLVTITKDGKKTDALAQTTKSGFIFLFNRETGHPLYPVEEMPFPVETKLEGEKLLPTQPIPTLPKPFVRQILTEADLNDLVPDSSYQDIKKRLAAYKTGNMFNAPSTEGTIIFPGYDGGAEWGGPGYDSTTGILYVNANEMPWVLTMANVKNKPVKNETNLQAGQRLYRQNCVACHGPERKGGENFPSLIDVNKRYNESTFHQLISNGRRRMPAFNRFTEAEKSAIASFVLEVKTSQEKKFMTPEKPANPYLQLPYSSTGYNKFLTKEGYPAVKPPWGTLTAINLNTAEVVWKDTLGDYPELKAKGIHSGTENYGGPVVTAGGLVFIAATSDSKIRAFNKRTGQLLWEADLPAAGFATPAVYSVNGKQYIAIACGGGKLNKKSGDVYVTFGLP